MTAAQWMRHLVLSHPAYKRDSIVADEVAFDLVKVSLIAVQRLEVSDFEQLSAHETALASRAQACVAVAEGRRREPALLGKQWIKPLRTDDAYYVPLKQPPTVIHRDERESPLQRYAAR